ncbi:DUF3305 domain-containing protein [Shimia sp. Alg240-R146]|uniref:DUF3305 domain-containing protein n=1 Tax=Shimia sp. Alg240-R146 TaxID=2993449 RepID=UPI0022E0F379|nr:DUF3305 domain-containing protein [Shimia sp. Alg240-R146]
MRQAPVSLPLGIVVRRTPSVSRWAPWAYKAVSVIPGAGAAEWQVLREDGDVVEYHAATVPLELWHTDTEAYLTGLSARVPSIGVVMRDGAEGDTDHPYDVLLATASPYECQDYADSGEELLELVPMPEGLVALIRDFVQEHHEEEVFVKRRRDKSRVDGVEDGRGDPRISQLSDVFRAPRTGRPN